MLSDACHEFLMAFGGAAGRLADEAHRYAEPNRTIRYGEEIDALRRACVRVADAPADTEAGAYLLRLAVSVLHFHDTPPDTPQSKPREKEVLELVALLRANLNEEDRAFVPSLVDEITTEGAVGEAAASRLIGMLSRLGKPAYDLAVKIIADIGSATAKRMLGL